MLDGVREIADGAFEAVAPGAQIAKVEIQGRMLEAGFQCVLELFGGRGVLIPALGIDGLAKMQDDFGLFGLLEGDLAGAFHDGRETAAFLCRGTVVAVIEEDLCQLGHGLLAGLLHGVEIGGGNLGPVPATA